MVSYVISNIFDTWDKNSEFAIGFRSRQKQVFGSIKTGSCNKALNPQFKNLVLKNSLF